MTRRSQDRRTREGSDVAYPSLKSASVRKGSTSKPLTRLAMPETLTGICSSMVSFAAGLRRATDDSQYLTPETGHLLRAHSAEEARRKPGQLTLECRGPAKRLVSHFANGRVCRAGRHTYAAAARLRQGARIAIATGGAVRLAANDLVAIHDLHHVVRAVRVEVFHAPERILV